MLDFEKRDIVDVIMVMGLYDVEFVKLSSMLYWAKDPSNMYLEVKHLKHHYGGEIVEEVHLDAKL
jgi:hypothetical protein